MYCPFKQSISFSIKIDHKSELKISGVGYLVKLTEKGKSEIELDYDTNSGLLTSRSGVSDGLKEND